MTISQPPAALHTSGRGTVSLIECGAGRVLEVLVTGPPDADAVVVHYGTPMGLTPLPHRLDPASQGLRCVTFARPGYGRSTPRPGRTVADGAADTVTVLDALGVETFVTVGWSGGGPSALACAALLPERCLATAVLASWAPPREAPELWSFREEHEDIRYLLRGEDGAARRLWEESRADPAQANPDPAALVGGFRAPADRAFLTGENAAWLAAVIASGFEHGIEGGYGDSVALSQDWGFAVGQARDVMVWHGSDDPIIPPAHGVWLAQHCPGASLRLLPGEGHVSVGGHLPTIYQDLLRQAGARPLPHAAGTSRAAPTGEMP